MKFKSILPIFLILLVFSCLSFESNDLHYGIEKQTSEDVYSYNNDIYEETKTLPSIDSKASYFKRGRPDLYGLNKINKIAILSFGNPVFTDYFTDKIVNNSNWKVIDRMNLNAILFEQKLQLSGIINEETIVNIGKIAGVDMIIFGEYRDTSVTVKCIDIETAEYLAYKVINIDNVNGLSFKAALASTAVLPYTIEFEDEDHKNAIRVWYGDISDHDMFGKTETTFEDFKNSVLLIRNEGLNKLFKIAQNKDSLKNDDLPYNYLIESEYGGRMQIYISLNNNTYFIESKFINYKNADGCSIVDGFMRFEIDDKGLSEHSRLDIYYRNHRGIFESNNLNFTNEVSNLKCSITFKNINKHFDLRTGQEIKL